MTDEARRVAICEMCRFAKINWRKGDTYEQDHGEFRQATTETRPATSVQCRRHAPTTTQIEGQYDGWPWVSGDDWCGEYRTILRETDNATD